MIEVISLKNAVITLSDDGKFIKGICKAKELKNNGLKKQIEEAMRVRCI